MQESETLLMLVDVTTTCCAGGTLKLPKLFLLPIFLTFFWSGESTSFSLIQNEPFLAPFFARNGPDAFLRLEIRTIHEAIGLLQ